jgi:hypothetical protein
MSSQGDPSGPSPTPGLFRDAFPVSTLTRPETRFISQLRLNYAVKKKGPGFKRGS